jgi:hypothetical protein
LDASSIRTSQGGAVVSKPNVQRWECETNEFGDSDMQKNIIGNYVRYEDYARLKSEVVEIRKLIDKRMLPLPERTTLEEVERICSAHLLMGITINKIGNLNILLEDEVERLTKQAKRMSKSGWSLVNAYQYDASISYWNKCINDWQNADKGVQS